MAAIQYCMHPPPHMTWLQYSIAVAYSPIPVCVQNIHDVRVHNMYTACRCEHKVCTRSQIKKTPPCSEIKKTPSKPMGPKPLPHHHLHVTHEPYPADEPLNLEFLHLLHHLVYNAVFMVVPLLLLLPRAPLCALRDSARERESESKSKKRERERKRDKRAREREREREREIERERLMVEREPRLESVLLLECVLSY